MNTVKKTYNPESVLRHLVNYALPQKRLNALKCLEASQASMQTENAEYWKGYRDAVLSIRDLIIDLTGELK